MLKEMGHFGHVLRSLSCLGHFLCYFSCFLSAMKRAASSSTQATAIIFCLTVGPENSSGPLRCLCHNNSKTTCYPRTKQPNKRRHLNSGRAPPSLTWEKSEGITEAHSMAPGTLIRTSVDTSLRNSINTNHNVTEIMLQTVIQDLSDLRGRRNLPISTQGSMFTAQAGQRQYSD